MSNLLLSKKERKVCDAFSEISIVWEIGLGKFGIKCPIYCHSIDEFSWKHAGMINPFYSHDLIEH